MSLITILLMVIVAITILVDIFTMFKLLNVMLNITKENNSIKESIYFLIESNRVKDEIVGFISKRENV